MRNRMGRAAEFIDFINLKELPSRQELRVRYSYLSATTDVRKARTDYRARLREHAEKNSQTDLFKP